jgi:hypothetical protein
MPSGTPSVTDWLQAFGAVVSAIASVVIAIAAACIAWHSNKINHDRRQIQTGPNACRKVYIEPKYAPIETDGKGKFVRITGDDDPKKISQRTGLNYQVIVALNPVEDFRNLPEGFKVYLSSPGKIISFDPR